MVPALKLQLLAVTRTLAFILFRFPAQLLSFLFTEQHEMPQRQVKEENIPKIGFSFKNPTLPPLFEDLGNNSATPRF